MSGLEGVTQIKDDIVCHGVGEEHDRRLEVLLSHKKCILMEALTNTYKIRRKLPLSSALPLVVNREGGSYGP